MNKIGGILRALQSPKFLISVGANVSAVVILYVLGWLAWHNQLLINPQVAAVLTAAIAVLARWATVSFNSWVSGWVNSHFKSFGTVQQWVNSTFKQVWQIALTTGGGYLLGGILLAIYLSTWHGGAVEQRVALYVPQTGGGVVTNVLLALAAVKENSMLPLPQNMPQWRITLDRIALWAMIIVILIPLLILVTITFLVWVIGYGTPSHPGNDDVLTVALNTMIVGIAAITAGATNWFTYKKKTGISPIPSLNPFKWDHLTWLRVGYISELFWVYALIPAAIRTAAFFIGFIPAGFYNTYVVAKQAQAIAQKVLTRQAQAIAQKALTRQAQAIGQLVLTGGQQLSASLLNLLALAFTVLAGQPPAPTGQTTQEESDNAE